MADAGRKDRATLRAACAAQTPRSPAPWSVSQSHQVLRRVRKPLAVPPSAPAAASSAGYIHRDDTASGHGWDPNHPADGTTPAPTWVGAAPAARALHRRSDLREVRGPYDRDRVPLRPTGRGANPRAPRAAQHAAAPGEVDGHHDRGRFHPGFYGWVAPWPVRIDYVWCAC